MSESNVSIRLLRLLAWVLSYRDLIVAVACVSVITASTDQPLLVTVPLFILIGWFVPRNKR